jgi:hypothetical protein
MTKPLDKSVRKALVRLAEQNPDYRVTARIVLAIAQGRDDEQIARSTRATTTVIRDVREQYENEGLALFAGVLPEDVTGVPASPAPPQPEASPAQTVSTPLPSAEPGPETTPTPPPAEQPADVPTPPAETAPPAALPADEGALPRPTPVDEKPRPTKPEPQQLLPENAPSPDKALSLGALAAAFDVEMRPARHISQLARELFDITSNHHRLPVHCRDLLHAAALLHNIAEVAYPDKCAEMSAAIILHYEFHELSHEERQMLGAMVALQVPTLIPANVATFTSLEESLQDTTQILAALFRVALGLDSSGGQRTVILEWHEVPGEFDIVLTGRDAAQDAQQAQNNSELWNSQYSVPQLRFMAEDDAELNEVVEDIPHLPTLSDHDLAAEASNRLREHYTARVDYLSRRILRNDSGLLVSLWREFQRLTGIWLWLLPGSKPRQVFSDDTDWLAKLIQQALFYATVEDRTEALLDQTNPERDDPAGLHGLKTLHVYHAEKSAVAFEELRNALRSRRYQRWLTSVQNPIKTGDEATTFASQIGVRAWAYLGELRHLIETVNAAGMNADLSEMLTLEVMASFELDLRLLTDLLTYSASLLGTEVEQVLQVLEPLSNYVQAWQRIEDVARYAEDARDGEGFQDVKDFVVEALATIMREKADEMRWGLADMWEPLETRMFRRALALAIARP